MNLLIFSQSDPIDSKKNKQMKDKNKMESELKSDKEKNKAKGNRGSVIEEKEGPTALDLAKAFY